MILYITKIGGEILEYNHCIAIEAINNNIRVHYKIKPNSKMKTKDFERVHMHKAELYFKK